VGEHIGSNRKIFYRFKKKMLGFEVGRYIPEHLADSSALVHPPQLIWHESLAILSDLFETSMDRQTPIFGLAIKITLFDFFKTASNCGLPRFATQLAIKKWGLLTEK
jgi:hypothetical protein